jgi:hypothetical protein
MNLKNKDFWIKLSICLLITGVLIWIFSSAIIARWGNKEIGSFFEKSNYFTNYRVYLSSSEDSAKSYYLTGEIERTNICDTAQSPCIAIYLLHRVFWDNGANSTFDDCVLDNIKGNYCVDNEGSGWNIRIDVKK